MKSLPLHPFRKFSQAPAFSLVEVVLAIGIVSFALLTVLNLFGGMMKSSNDNSHRREFAEAVDALRSSLTDTNFAGSFSNVLTWAGNNKELVYVTYKANDDGTPNATSETVTGKWIDPAAGSTATYDAARSGRWLRARLQVSPSNPGGTNLANYARSMVFLQADLDSLATPDQIGQTNTSSSTLKTTLAIRR